MTKYGGRVVSDVVEGGFVSHYIVVAEVISPDGEGQIHTISDVDHAWQVLGTLGDPEDEL